MSLGRTECRFQPRATTLLFLIVVMAAGPFMACNWNPFGGGRIRIGVVLPFNDPGQGMGASQVRKALELASPAAGREYKLLYRDDKNEPTRTAEIVRELVEREGVSAIIGGMTSPCALAGAERAEALGVPFVTPMATNDGITRGKDWAFQACFSDTRQGERMARFVWGNLKIERVIVLRDVTNDYSLGLADSFTETYLRLGGVVVTTKTYRRGHDDGGTIMKWLEEHPADAIYLPLYRVDTIDIISKSITLWREKDPVFLGGDGWHSIQMRDFLSKSPVLPSRIYITAHFAHDEPIEPVQELVDIWRKQNDGEVPTSASALGWDLGHLLNRALDADARTPREVRDALAHEFARFDGATGSFRIDPETSLPTKDAKILRWDGEQWVLGE